ncbi:MAG: RnfABCDGE type electron transport complex subunit D [Lachnospiraceae bacterium]|nr:RnfABCDGE type electron transport complex subunit D [Lachnospiraceae bacterium]
MSMYNVSSSPHVRSKLSTGRVMYDVILSLLPATVIGCWHFGMKAVIVVLASVITAVASEAVFDKIRGQALTVKDGSAVVTGLLLALCLSPEVPLYIPILGALFAIIIVKCLFGGLGKNFMNPALAARCFLLISFSGTMTRYVPADAVSTATPLVDLAEGKAVNMTQLFMGFTPGVIGCSILGLLIGGLYLWVTGGITWEIPVAALGSFSIFVILFGGQGPDPMFLAAHLCGGGIMMGALFMATDPVTSPVTRPGQLLYGACVGIFSGLFRIFGSSADSVSYAIILSNLFTPMIDQFIVPKPYAYQKSGSGEEGFFSMKLMKPALILCAITFVAGVALSGVFDLTREAIEAQELAAQMASYQEVLPDAQEFEPSADGQAVIDSLEGGVYGTDFGRVHINGAYEGKDASGNVTGYVVSVTTSDGYDGDVTLSAGISADGTLQGISFTELNETAGMGMRADEPEFKDQFSGVNVEKFTLNKAGGSTADDEIDSISGASVTSGAVVNAVNAAIDFFNTNLK